MLFAVSVFTSFIFTHVIWFFSEKIFTMQRFGYFRFLLLQKNVKKLHYPHIFKGRSGDLSAIEVRLFLYKVSKITG